MSQKGIGVADSARTADSDRLIGNRRAGSTAHFVRIQLYVAFAAADLAALVLAFALPTFFREGPRPWYAILGVTAPIYVWAAVNTGAFSITALRSSRKGIASALQALLFALGALLLISYFFRIEQRLPRLTILATMTAAACLIVLARLLIGRLLTRRSRRAVTAEMFLRDGVGIDAPAGMLLVDTRDCRLTPDLRDPQMMNDFAALIRGMDRVVIACAPDDRKKWAMMLKGANMRGEVLANDFDAIGAIGIDSVEDHTTLVVSTGPLLLHQRVTKRAFDLAFAIPVLVIIAPILIAVAIAIKLDSRGPVLFKQRRVGRGNAFFNILKFRSMHVDLTDEHGRVSASRDDRRITRVGRFIRRTSIDELPQLLNVVLGSMSVVGPRPHALGSLAGEHLFWEIDERYWHRHALKPGITGLAQVRGFRGATHHRHDLTRRLQADLEYIADWSIWRDLSIILSTLRMTSHQNAY